MVDSITIGGITIYDPVSLHRCTSHTTFIGPIQDMPYFTPYFHSYLETIQVWLYKNHKPPLTTIHAIRYIDKYSPRRFLTMWIAYSEDGTIGWYKYAGLVAGGTYHKLMYEGSYHRVPSKRQMYPRVNRLHIDAN